MKQKQKKSRNETIIVSPYFQKSVVSPYFQNVKKPAERDGNISKYFKSSKKNANSRISIKSEEKKQVPWERQEDANSSAKNSVVFINNKKLVSFDIDALASMRPVVHVPKFIPMQSPYNLVQETLYYDPWKLLVATTFLNRTKGTQALPIMWQFLEGYPTPQKTIKADATEIADLLHPLGLQNIRAERLIKFSLSYLANPDFSTPKELFGMGQYAEDSWRLFCGEKDDAWMEGSGCEPTDKMLRMYIIWRRVVHRGLLHNDDDDRQLPPFPTVDEDQIENDRFEDDEAC
ncbi:8724_t:CDS:2 [Acaulospora morrowiae]|uniref:Methyl-CpG-binding domain protein 4 n=1 Tax=Acaulospora morrowiae TaxID=94023 RepID=A0A9N9GW34_9GLOM|nr:8724_t:CDS:2 [Acaulospora morrowiae]